MPHIRVIFPKRNKKVRKILLTHGKEIRKAVRKVFPMYSLEAIVIIPEPLSKFRVKLSSNLLPLGFVIDVGKQNSPLNDSQSDNLRVSLIAKCPKLDDINFSVWVREMPSNGFTHHKPKKKGKK